MINHFHSLMTFMAQLSRLSSESMAKISKFGIIKSQAEQIGSDLAEWWQSCPPALRDQRNDWRRQARPRKLTIPETLEEEAFSSIKSCMYGCVIYLNHILDPLGRQPQKPEVTKAIKEILENAQEVPEEYGLEMGHYWGLFMVGISVFNDDEKEVLLRRMLRSDSQTSIYVSLSSLKKDICLTGFYSILIALLNFSKFFGADIINTDASTIGEKCRFKWAFRCRSFAPSAL
jgi:hypothetical protein